MAVSYTIFTYTKSQMEPNIKKKKKMTTEDPVDTAGNQADANCMISRKEMTEKLIQIVGTFDDIKRRQEMFRIMNIVNGYGDIDSVSISSGSLSEGLNMKGSDEDITLILKYVVAVPSYASFVGNKEETVVLVDIDHNYPGFAKIYPVLGATVSGYVQSASVVSSLQFRDQFLGSGHETHGPCCNNGQCDIAVSIRCPFLPDIVTERFENRKSKWLQEEFQRDMFEEGCLLVPIGPRVSEKRSILWRMSFILAERKMILKMNHAQILCYALLKIFLKEGLEQDDSVKDVLCSYFLKTCVFWLIDETDNDDQVWNVENVLDCYELCLDKLILWVTNDNCPNYFIPDNNMLSGRISKENKDVLLSLLRKYKVEGCLALLRCESFRVQTEVFTDAQREANLDFFGFRVLHLYPYDEIELAYAAARDLEDMYKTETDGFVLGVINKLRSSAHQEIAQMLPLSYITEGSDDGSNRQAFEKHRDHIIMGGESDALSGPLMLACFYYNLGHYTQALEVLGEAEEKLTPNLIVLRKEIYSKQEYELYLDSMCGKGLTLSYKMKHATVNVLVMLENSSLIPEEFLPEVLSHRPVCMIPATVLMYSVEYLCHNRLLNAHKKLDALTKLKSAVKNKLFILSRYYSTALTFLGVCYETDGDMDKALEYYKLALEYPPVFRGARYRIDRLQLTE